MINQIRPPINKIRRLGAMTVCIATLCKKQKCLVLVSDKKIGIGFIENELNITKIKPICRDWWVMMAGNDISSIFDIVSYAKRDLKGNKLFTTKEVIDSIEKAYKQKREEESETVILSPIGWTLKKFASDGGSKLNPIIYERIQDKLMNYELPIELIVAGFDENSIGHIFSLDHPGIHKSWDIPGFYAIGSGKYAAIQMMVYRELNINMQLCMALYYSFEAKLFSEYSPGVGIKSDIYILKGNRYHRKISESTEHNLEKVWKIVHPVVRIKKPLKKFPECKKLLEENRNK